MLRLDQITCRIGPRTLFDGASATVNPGHRVGFVGRNGARRLQFRSANWRALPPDSAFWAISFSS